MLALEERRADRGPSAPPLSGFIHYSTKQTQVGTQPVPKGVGTKATDFNEGLYVIDRTESRNRRMRSSVITAARLLDEQSKAAGHRSRVAFVTLTYRGVDDWRPNHFRQFATTVREWCKRRNAKFRYVFKAELQQRGAVHYHMLVWLPKGITLPKPDKQGWWPHGMTKIEYARNPVAYIAKYASKSETGKPFPKGCRYHGSGGLTGHLLNEKRWWQLPTWAREKFAIEDRATRAEGGGLVSRSDGSYHASPYFVVSHGQGKIVIMKRDIPQVH